MFNKQIGRNMEVNMDDMLVKSKEEPTHLDDFKETFAILRQYQMKLNPSKCTFGVASGKFLGFMVSQRGIEANLEKVRAILDMASPKTVKEVQKLTGRIAALNMFVSIATDKCLPFFKTLNLTYVKLLFTTLCFVGLYSMPNLIVMLFNLLYLVFVVGFHCKGCVLERECVKTQAIED